MALTVPALPTELFSMILGINTKQIKQDKLESHLKTRGKASIISEPDVAGDVKVIIEGRQYIMTDDRSLVDHYVNLYGDVNDDGTVDWIEGPHRITWINDTITHRDEVDDYYRSQAYLDEDYEEEEELEEEEESEEEDESEEYEFEFEGVKYIALGDMDVIDDEYNYMGEFNPFDESIEFPDEECRLRHELKVNWTLN